MIDFYKNFKENRLFKYLLNDDLLIYLLNKQELESLYFYLLKNNGLIIQFIKKSNKRNAT